jgi:DNA (cytosine-5)-methyltransferase 1
MRYLSLFSGIEAASVAWHPLGWSPVAFAEVEPFPSAVLAERFPDVPNFGDVTKFKEWPDVCKCDEFQRIRRDEIGGISRSVRSVGGETSDGNSLCVQKGQQCKSKDDGNCFTTESNAIGTGRREHGSSYSNYCKKCGGFDGSIDLICGGSPCQSFSVAGLRKGMDDPRGNLALTYLAIVEKYRPKWVVWENVPGVLSSNGGRDFGSFLGALDEIGYGYAWRVLDAQYTRTPVYPRAVPQRRKRVFVVGCLGDWRSAAAVLFDSESLCGNPPPSREAGKGFTAIAPSGSQFKFDRRSDDTIRCFQQNTRDEVRYINSDGAIAGALMADAGMKQQNYVAYETNPTDARCSEIEDGVGPTVKARWGTGGNNQALVQKVSGVDLYNQQLTHDVHCPLRTAGGHGAPAVAFEPGSIARNAGPAGESDTCPTLRSQMGDNQPAARIAMQVRRLTPLECERLQGFPDGWTQIAWRKKPAEECPDGPRYKAIGNSMAVNVMQWIGLRIAMMNEILEEGLGDADNN